MQTIDINDSVVSIAASARASGGSAKSIPMPSGMQYPYQPSEPHVLTEDLKAQLAEANQRRRENLYPRLAQTLATVEQSNIARSYSEERAMSLQELAAANKARRSKLREAGYALPMASMA